MDSLIPFLELIIGRPAQVVQVLVTSVVIVLLYVVGIYLAVIRMRSDYFVRTKSGVNSPHSHPALRFLLQAAKNIFGIFLIIVGFLMLVLPGQGVLTILIGVTLLDFPGKQRFVIALVQRKIIREFINRIRLKAGQPPIDLPPP